MNRSNACIASVILALILLIIPAYSAPQLDNNTMLSDIRLSPSPLVSASDAETLAIVFPVEAAQTEDGLSIAKCSVSTGPGNESSPVYIEIGDPDAIGINTNIRDAKHARNLLTAGLLLIPLDKTVVRMIPRTGSNEDSDTLTEVVNLFGERSVLLGIIGGMYLLGDSGDKETSRLMASAVANAGLLTGALKVTVGRDRPGRSGDEIVFNGPSFTNDKNSFPSGHTAIAFAAATVLSERHPKQKWLYYALATGVGLARIRKSEHFPSDVLAGAGIGIYSGNKALRSGPKVLGIRF